MGVLPLSANVPDVYRMSDTTTARALANRFIARWDVKAWQQPSGIYVPDRSPIEKNDVLAHVEGQRTLGHYLVSSADLVKFFCFDIDLRKTGNWNNDGVWEKFSPRTAYLTPDHPARPDLVRDLRCMAEGLARRVSRLFDVPVSVVDSGCKGLHVYAHTGAVPAREAREGARAILDSFERFEPIRGHWLYAGGPGMEHTYENLEIELFPKQDSLDGKDLGNLLRLPLGVNRKSGRRSFFVHLPETGGWTELPAAEALAGQNPW